MKNNLHTERSFSMDKGKFTVTRQVDFNIKEKVDRHTLLLKLLSDSWMCIGRLLVKL